MMSKFQKHFILSDNSFNTDFVFNTINAIYHSIDNEPTLAKQTLLGFSDLLRYFFYDYQFDTITLSKEWEFIKKYLEIERIRKAQMKIEYNINFDNDLQIKPGILVYLTGIIVKASYNVFCPCLTINIQENLSTIVYISIIEKDLSINNDKTKSTIDDILSLHKNNANGIYYTSFNIIETESNYYLKFKLKTIL